MVFKNKIGTFWLSRLLWSLWLFKIKGLIFKRSRDFFDLGHFSRLRWHFFNTPIALFNFFREQCWRSGTHSLSKDHDRLLSLSPGFLDHTFILEAIFFTFRDHTPSIFARAIQKIKTPSKKDIHTHSKVKLFDFAFYFFIFRPITLYQSTPHFLINPKNQDHQKDNHSHTPSIAL